MSGLTYEAVAQFAQQGGTLYFAAIFAGVNGYLDGCEVSQVTRYEQGLLSELRANHAEMLATIRNEGTFSDETEGKIKGALDAYTKTFVA